MLDLHSIIIQPKIPTGIKVQTSNTHQDVFMVNCLGICNRNTFRDLEVLILVPVETGGVVALYNETTLQLLLTELRYSVIEPRTGGHKNLSVYYTLPTLLYTLRNSLVPPVQRHKP